jgi:O-antigen ligase
LTWAIHSAACLSDRCEAVLVLAFVLATLFFIIDHHFNASLEWNKVTAGRIAELSSKVARGTPSRRTALLTLIALSAVCLARHRVNTSNIDWPLLVLLLAYLCWSFLTILWSLNKSLTLRRLVAWCAVMLTAFAVSQYLSLSECVLLITLCSLSFLLIGLATELWQGALKVRRKYRFAGTLHPNQQGVNCGLLIFSSFYLFRESGNWPVYAGIAVIACAALLLTRSRGAAWATAAACSLWWMIERGMPGHVAWNGAQDFSRVAIMAIIGGASVLVIVSLKYRVRPPRVLVSSLLLGRRSHATSTLTGRLPLWWSMIRMVGLRAFWGIGYGCFWNSTRIISMAQQTKWKFSDSHSAYIETLMGTGLPGLLLFISVLGLTFAAGLQHAGYEGAFIAAFTLFVIIQGLIESTFTIPNFFSFALLLIISSVINRA